MYLQIVENQKRLKNTTTDIYLPDFVVITGANGSGKSQLLESIKTNFKIDSMQEKVFYPSSTLKNADEVPYDREKISLIGLNQFQPHSGNAKSIIEDKANFQRLLSISNIIASEIELNPAVDVLNPNNFNTEFLRIYITPEATYNPSILRELQRVELEVIDIVAKKSGKALGDLKFHDFTIYSPIPKSGLFSSNLTTLFLQFLQKEKYYPHKADEEVAPWITFEKILERGKLPFNLVYPKLNESGYVEALLLDKDTGQQLKFEGLSSGEKTIMSLVFALYNSELEKNSNESQFPEVILFDEPDASLHPSLTKNFLQVIQDVFIKDNKVKVIMTTHSPSTIALSPIDSIFLMKNGNLELVNKDDAIISLTEGLSNLTILYEHVKQVFVEAEFDVYFYQTLYNLILNDYLNPDKVLTFMASGKKNEAGCDKVIEYTNLISANGNKTICGLIDWDLNKNRETDRIIVFGLNKRYTVENYVFDPTFLAFFLLLEQAEDVCKIGFDLTDNIITVTNISQEKLQNCVNLIVDRVYEHRVKKISPDDTPTRITLLNGYYIMLPKWYLISPGHALEESCIAAFPKLNGFNQKPDKLKKEIVNKVIKLHYRFLPDDIIEPFSKLQSISVN
ncbi:ATP-binding protein [Mucilaginibacter rubeus]|uniref:ATP-binding protein n=1 Tax=Mucilaginibacter rubeus TaxID=2027860 RepID=A0A5C1I3X7_9SPHI|nr:ATP-binding protein [Mucilaginibacter rubeus]QEM11851.1 ATP-binding protein [Mucilaginibacter rubeus]